MVYTELTRKAMIISEKAHHDQLDVSGYPYIFHPFMLASVMDDEVTCAVALLHDVIEDTSVTLDDLRKEGMPENVIEAVKLLTHDKKEDYFIYLERLCHNDIARRVKKEDLRHNSNLDRLPNLTKHDLERKDRYDKAFIFIKEYELKLKNK